MPRFAAVRNGVVVGVLAAGTPLTQDVPAGMVFVDVTDQPNIQGGETYDGVMFTPAAMSTGIAARLAKAETDIQQLKAKTP